jgi:hypothetical protein
MNPFEKIRNAQLEPGFPITIARLREIYSTASFEFEYYRLSFADFFREQLATCTLDQVAAALTKPTALPPQPVPALLQRYFYWSAACFYRAFYLMLAYLVLERRPMPSWAHVTAYYSRFYIIKAILSLFLTNIVDLRDKQSLRAPKDTRLVVYTCMGGVRARRIDPLKKQWGAGGSHQIWWALFEQMKYVPDFPEMDGAQFILSDAYFNSATRNNVNYSEEYFRGFPELEWFDSSEEDMVSQLEAWRPRADRDITDVESFFGEIDPEICDEGDFYGDEAQIVWLSIRVYLELLKQTGVQQAFITKGKVLALLERYAEGEYPTLCAGIRKSIANLLP